MRDLFHDVLDSARDRRVRAAIDLRDDVKARRQEGACFVEGIRTLQEALAAGIRPRTVFISPRLASDPLGARLLDLLHRQGAATLAVSDRLMERLADTRAPQGVVAVVDLAPPGTRPPAPAAGRPLLVAAGVQDPGNLGALLRAAEALGASGFLASGGADPHHPRAVRASAGAVFRMRPVVLAPPALLEALRGSGHRIAVSLPRHGTPSPVFDWLGRWALVVGGEGGGAPPDILNRADARVSIPMEGRAESLSVATAAAVLLHDAARAREAAAPAPALSPRRAGGAEGRGERPRRRGGPGEG